MSVVAERGDYYIGTEVSAFDFTRIHHWLSTDAYWSMGIPLDTVKKAFDHSLSFGVFHRTEGQVGVARMISDTATFAYLADVYIVADHRGQGLGTFLMDTIVAHPDLQGLRRQMLATNDMHSLYRKYGFADLAKPDILMEKVMNAPYKTCQ